MKGLRLGAASGKTRTVRCPECGDRFEVAAKALSVACPHCSRRVILEDYRIKGYHASRDFATAGDIVVERAATVSAPIKVQHLKVKGNLRGAVLARGSVEVTRTGELRGDVTSPSLVVQRGGTLEGYCCIGVAPPKPRRAGRVRKVAAK